MQSPPIPADETQRLRALRSLSILDTLPDEAFDRITRFAVQSFKVPVSTVSFIDRDRQWLKSEQGLGLNETSRTASFCAHTILGQDSLVVPDSHDDPRFAPGLHDRDEGIRFYAGHPLRAPDGQRIGAFCIADWRPRVLSGVEQDLLVRLARDVEDEIRKLADASTDPVTGVANLQGFRARANYAFDQCRRHGERSALLVLELHPPDHRLPRNLEDTLLGDFADLMLACFPPASIIARRDEWRFLVYGPRCHLKDLDDAVHRLDRRFQHSTLAMAHPGLRWHAGAVELRPGSAEGLPEAIVRAERHMTANRATGLPYGDPHAR